MDARRALVTVVITLVTAAFVAGCGGGAAGSTATTLGAPSTSVSRTTSSATNLAGTYGSGSLGFAKCMRANRVPNFPDPSSAPGQLFNTAGIDTSAPAFLAASAKCHRLTGGGPPAPGPTHPSAQTLAKLRRIAVCMRAHGISDFPDPRTNIPAQPPADIREITNFDGVILLFPSTLNMEAPAYRQALTACGAPPLGLPH